MNWINQLLQGTDGSPSAMRVGFVIVLAAVCFEHVWASVHGQPQAWDWQQVGLVVGTFGAKATQRAFEKDGTPTVTPPPKTP